MRSASDRLRGGGNERGPAVLDNALRPSHVIIVVLVFVVLFGAKRLPDAARGLGRSLRIFKSEIGGLSDDPSPTVPETKSRPLPHLAAVAASVDPTPGTPDTTTPVPSHRKDHG